MKAGNNTNSLTKSTRRKSDIINTVSNFSLVK